MKNRLSRYYKPYLDGQDDLGFRVLGFRVLGFRVLGFRALGFRGLSFSVQGS